MDFKAMCRDVRARALDARAIANLLERDVFTKAWDLATDDERATCAKLLLELRKSEVDDWLRLVLDRDIAERSVRELRARAKACGVAYYSHLSKAELLSELAPKKGKPDVGPAQASG